MFAFRQLDTTKLDYIANVYFEFLEVVLFEWLGVIYASQARSIIRSVIQRSRIHHNTKEFK